MCVFSLFCSINDVKCVHVKSARIEKCISNKLSGTHSASAACSGKGGATWLADCSSIPLLQNKDPGGEAGSTSRGWRLVGLGVERGMFRGGDGWV